MDCIAPASFTSTHTPFCDNVRPLGHGTLRAYLATHMIGVIFKNALSSRSRIGLALLAVAITGLLLLSLIPSTGAAYEFDQINFRCRSCSLYRSWLFGFVLLQQCGEVWDHPTAIQLRELGVLKPIRENEARWVLIKELHPGRRSDRGQGIFYLNGLGAITFGTPVPLPEALEDLENPWVKWASKDKDGARLFWESFEKLSMRTALAGDYLVVAKEYLEAQHLEVDAVKMLADLAPRWNFLAEN
jgi:hypothetical protein